MSRDFHPTINVLIYFNYIDNIQTSSKSVTIRFILSVIWKNTITRIPYFFTHTRVYAATSYFPVGSPTGNLSTHRFFPPIWGNTHILVSLEPSTNVPRRSFQAARGSATLVPRFGQQLDAGLFEIHKTITGSPFQFHAGGTIFCVKLELQHDRPYRHNYPGVSPFSRDI